MARSMLDRSRPILIPGLLFGTLAAVSATAGSNVRLAAVGPTPASSVAAGSLALRVDPAAWNELAAAGEATVREFPLADGSLVELELRAFSVLAPDARLIEASPLGEERREPPPMRFFRGAIAGEAASSAYLWLRDGRIGGVVRRRLGAAAVHVFGPRSPRFGEAASREHVVTLVASTLAAVDAPAYCSGGVAAPGDRLAPPERPPGVLSDVLMSAVLAVDATVEYHDHFGDLDDAAAYMMALFGEVSTFYERDVLCQLHVGYLRIFSAEPDPYTSGTTSTSTLLADVRSEWTTNPEVMDVERVVTHLVTRVNGMGGRAYVDVLCSGGTGYGISSVHGSYTYPSASYTWDADVIAHELGHNFGSGHTHCYTPEIDRCYNGQSGCYGGPVEDSVGTIMSYCHLRPTGKSLDFHPRVVDVIRPRVEAAACIEAAGSPGRVPSDGGRGLKLVKAPVDEELRADDGGANGSSAFGGDAQAAWVKRFTPPCLPFALAGVDMLVSSSSVSPGRDIRVLVYADPSGSGDPANAALVHSEDTTVQVVGSDWNRFELAAPVTVAAGDLYLGFYDLVADPADTFIMRFDNSASGDSYSTANTTDPGSYSLRSGRTWMTRGRGDCGVQTVRLAWDAPCNDSSVPGQDFGVYEGTLDGLFQDHASVTCTTGRAREFALPALPAGDRYYVVVPASSTAEGSYGDLAPAASPCRPQEVGACD